MARTAAIGVQDFGMLIEKNYFYVDKTDFIKEWWESGDMVTLITRPRRFGKTLAMSMLEYFFSIRHAGRSSLFEKLSIWREEGYRKLQGTYPVIFLSFAGVKGRNYSMVREQICRLLIDIYSDYEFLLESSALSDEDRKFFRKITSGMSDADAAVSVRQLSKYLSNYYGRKAVVLLDEYDTPMQEAYVSGYWDEMADFTRSFFNSSFKTNPHLERAVMTGITRVGRESVFSDLNNLTVITTTSEIYAESFGFTEKEVFCALDEYSLQKQKDEVKRWYDGFRFGSCGSIYNPWSIINYLKFKQFKPYWANTSSNALIGKLVRKGSPKVKIAVEDLLQGRAVCTMLDEQIVFKQLDYDEAAIWSFLLAGGYLKIAGSAAVYPELGAEGVKYELMLTNLEIVLVFRKMIQGWFAACSSFYNDFTKAFLMNDLKNMNLFMNRIAQTVISFFDAGNQMSETSEPERFYHGLVLGLMVDLHGRYTITSNRESGFGRYDVMVEPCSDADDGIILEFKVKDPQDEKNLQDTAESAVHQILDKKYAAALEAKGISRDKIRIYGFAFRGKEVLIDGGYLAAYETE